MTTSMTQSVQLKAGRRQDGTPVVALISPYHPALPARAKAAGGQFGTFGDEKAWVFDPRDTERVREICREIFGEDPLAEEPVERVTLRVDLSSYDSIDSNSLWICGREVLRRPVRDAQVRLGQGVVLLAGTFTRRAGSARHPAIGSVAGVVLEVRDVPRELAERYAAEHEGASVIPSGDVHSALQQVMDRQAAQPPQPQDESDVERVWRQVAALSEQDQAEIRNRLLQQL